jgi:hypothetical protein
VGDWGRHSAGSRVRNNLSRDLHLPPTKSDENKNERGKCLGRGVLVLGQRRRKDEDEECLGGRGLDVVEPSPPMRDSTRINS